LKRENHLFALISSAKIIDVNVNEFYLIMIV